MHKMHIKESSPRISYQILMMSTLKSYSPPLNSSNQLYLTFTCLHIWHHDVHVCFPNIIFKKTVLAVSRLARAPWVRWSQFTLLHCSVLNTSCILHYCMHALEYTNQLLPCIILDRLVKLGFAKLICNGCKGGVGDHMLVSRDWTALALISIIVRMIARCHDG